MSSMKRQTTETSVGMPAPKRQKNDTSTNVSSFKKLTDSPPGAWKLSKVGSFTNPMNKFLIQGVDQSMNQFLQPPDDIDGGRISLLFVGARHLNDVLPNGRKVHVLNGAIRDMEIFLGQFDQEPNKNVIILCDFMDEAREWVEKMKARIHVPWFGCNPDKSTYAIKQLCTHVLRQELTIYMPLMDYVTKTVIHVSCHGTKTGFVMPIYIPPNSSEIPNLKGRCTEYLENSEFAKWIVTHGVNRQKWWAATESGKLRCNPLNLTMYLDRCHASQTMPLKWLFSIKTGHIQNVLNPTEQGQADPAKCHMNIVCLSACGPDDNTPEYRLRPNDVPCGLFTHFLHVPCPVGTIHTTINQLVHGWNSFNTHTFSMVPVLWFHMDKNISRKMAGGFYWSTNVDCPGADELLVKIPTDQNGALLWGNTKAVS